MPDKLKELLLWATGAACLVLLALVLTQTTRLYKAQAELAKEKATYAQAYANNKDLLAKAVQRARDAEHNMQDSAVRITKEKDDELKANTARYRSIIAGLQDRPTRPTPTAGSTSEDSGDAKRGTGAGLYREDGEFLAGEAAESNRRRTALAACYKQYDEIAEQLQKSQ